MIMKKLFKMLAVLFVLVVLFLTYQFFNFRKSCYWESKNHRIDFTGKRTVTNQLHQILYLNDIYRNYNSFSPKNDIRLNKFSAELSTLSVIKGKKRKKKGDILLTGKEVIIAAWDIDGLM